MKKCGRDSTAVKGIDCSCRDPEFSSEQLHDDSQPFLMRSGALFCSPGIHVDRTLYS